MKYFKTPIVVGLLLFSFSAYAQQNSNYGQTNTEYANKLNWVRGAGSSTGTSATTIISAPAANKLYITGVQCSRDDAGTSAIYITFNDDKATTLILPNNGGGGGNNAIYNPPLVLGTVTTAFTFTPSSAITTVRCDAQGYNAP